MNPPPDSVHRVGIIGAGLLGTSLTHVSAQAGLETVVKVRPTAGAVQRGEMAVRASLDREVTAQRLTQAEADAAFNRLHVTDNYANLDQCPIVVEVVSEQFELKQKVFGELEAALPTETIIASSTSSYRIAGLAAGLSRPERVVGMHYFWPAHRRRLVEVAPHTATTVRATRLAQALAVGQAITPLLVKDSPGFLTTRLIFVYFAESIRLLGQGVPIETVDAAAQSFGWQMGPFRIMDIIGFETLSQIHDSLLPIVQERGEAMSLLKTLLQVGLAGRKSGAGFYLYDGKAPRPNPLVASQLPYEAGQPGPDELTLRPIHMFIHEALHCLAEGVVEDWRAIDIGSTLGLAFPTNHGGGVHSCLREIGWNNFVRSLHNWARRYGTRFRPDWETQLQFPD